MKGKKMYIKKMIACLLVVGAITVILAAQATTPVAGNYSTSPGTPSNIEMVSLGSSTTTDSLYMDSGKVIYGPYNLCIGNKRSSFKGFQAYMPVGGLASGDSISFAYQIIPGVTVADTNSSWTVADTLITGKKGTYVDISSRAGITILFRLKCIDTNRKVGLIAGKKTKVVFMSPSYETK